MKFKCEECYWWDEDSTIEVSNGEKKVEDRFGYCRMVDPSTQEENGAVAFGVTSVSDRCPNHQQIVTCSCGMKELLGVSALLGRESGKTFLKCERCETITGTGFISRESFAAMALNRSK